MCFFQTQKSKRLKSGLRLIHFLFSGIMEKIGKDEITHSRHILKRKRNLVGISAKPLYLEALVFNERQYTCYRHISHSLLVYSGHQNHWLGLHHHGSWQRLDTKHKRLKQFKKCQQKHCLQKSHHTVIYEICIACTIRPIQFVLSRIFGKLTEILPFEITISLSVNWV